MAEKQLLTKKGYDEKLEELEYRKIELRKEISQKLAEAREQGDLSENAEYDAAKDEQAENERKIAELEELLSNVEVASDSEKGKTKVRLSSVVTLHDIELDEEVVFTIVGSAEADILNNMISNESPIGAALIGKKKGDTVTFEAPAGEVSYKIIKVDNSNS